MPAQHSPCFTFLFLNCSVKCRKGVCHTPLEIVASEVILTAQPYGEYVAKGLLYPAALVADITDRIFPQEGQPVPDTFLPDWDKLLDRYGYTNLNITDPELNNRIELNAGANLVVFGSILSLLHDNKMAMLGVVLTTFFFVKQHAWLPKENEELSPEKSYIFLMYIPFVVLGAVFPALSYLAEPKGKKGKKVAVKGTETRAGKKDEATSVVKGKKELKTIKRK